MSFKTHGSLKKISNINRFSLNFSNISEYNSNKKLYNIFIQMLKN